MLLTVNKQTRMTDTKVREISCFLKLIKFHVAENWVKECVEFYLANNPEISLEVLKEEVKQQWLLSNLRDMRIPCLPADLKRHHKTVLCGTYVIQVDTMVDVGSSRYSQLQALRNDPLENIKATTKKDDEPSVRRCLCLTVTDGVQDLKAMEYEIIPQLKLNDPDMPPGFKIMLSGQITTRRGMLLLRKENVTICGGEVDTLAESNRLENILAGHLGVELQMTRNEPPSIEAIDLISEPDVEATYTNTSVNQFRENEGEIPSFVASNFDNEMDFMFSESDDILLSVADGAPDNVDLSAACPKTGTELSAPVKKQKTINSFFKNDTSKSNNECVRNSRREPITTSHEPFVYLKQIKNENSMTSGVFKVKAIILTLKTKIQITDGEFSLLCKISDGSLSIDVKISSEILEDLLGFSPCEMDVMLRSKRTNPNIAERLKSAFTSAQRKLISLDCIFHIQFTPNSEPSVIKLEEINSRHLNAMKSRQIT